MSHLSQALEKYYSRQGRRIFFKNEQSLNQLALTMWEQLGCQQIDASVVSRVIKGERLFTSQQLKIFCKLLAISKQEEHFLFACLREDYNAKFNLPLNITQLSSSLTQEIIAELTANAFSMFYQGNYDALEKKHDLVQQLANAYMAGGRGSKTIDEAIGLNLYIKGRTLANGELPNRVIGKILPISKQLVAMSKISGSWLLYGYAYVLLSNAYYLAGGYSTAAKQQKFYTTSIKLAAIAIDVLPEDDHERLFALRLIAASSSYNHDTATLRYVLKKTRGVLPKQPKNNYINMLHLTMSLSKGLATNGMPNPFAIREQALSYFQRDLANTGVYEVSGIKEEVDTLICLKTQDKSYVESQIQAGIRLAREYHFSRQRKYFVSLLRAL